MPTIARFYGIVIFMNYRDFSVSENRAIVTVVFGERANNLLGLRKGKAIIFERQIDGQWKETAKLEPDIAIEKNEQWPEQFGWSVSISGDIALVGACNDQSGWKLATDNRN